MDPNDFNSYLTNLTTVNGAPAPSAIPQTPPAAGGAPAPAPSGGGSWWKSLLPAAGGVLGGLLGGAADVASLGVLAPLINPITGAALGGAAGQAGENALTGKSVIQGNDITSGVENALGEGTGMVGGKIVGALGKGITAAGAKAGEKVATDAVEKAATGNLVNDSELTKLNYGGISPKLANDFELGKSQKFVGSMGFDATNPYDMGKVADSNSELNNVYDHALQQSSPVNMSDIGDALGATKADTSALSKAELAAMQKQGITPELAKNGEIMGAAPEGAGGTYQGIEPSSPIGQALADYNKSAGAEPMAKLPEQMNPTEVRKLQQAVGRQIGNTHNVINNAELNGNYNTEAQGSLAKLQDVYEKLGNKIKTPEVNDAIKGYQVTDADKQGLIAKYGDKLGNHIVDTIGNAKSADDLLGPMQDLTKMGRASRMAINDIENVTNSPRAVARAKFEANGGVVPSTASKGAGGVGDAVQTAASIIHKPAAAVIAAGRKIHEAGLTPKIAEGLGNVIQRTAPLIAPATVAGSNIPNMAAGLQGGSAIPSSTGDPNMQPGAPAPTNPTNDLLTTLLAQEQAAPTVLGPSLAPTLSALAPAATANELGAGSIAALAPTYGNAGGASGLGGGLIDKLLAHIPGTAANTYQNQQAAAAAQIAKILGITPQAALAMLPQLAQNPGTAAPQQAATSGLVGQLTAGLPAQ